MKTGDLRVLGSFNAGVWQRVYSKTFTAAATSLTISGIGGNLLVNSDFETWAAGASAAPTGWTFFGASSSVAREGTTKQIGSYSAKVVKVTDANAGLYNATVCSDKGIVYYRGKTLTFGCWVWCATANTARIALAGAVDPSLHYSSYHTGDSTWQWLSVSYAVYATETTEYVFLYVDGADATAYFDGAICMEAAAAPKTTSSNIDQFCLNGDYDVEYLLRMNVSGGYNGTASAGITFNTDTGTNYGRQYLRANNTTASTGRDFTVEVFASFCEGLGQLSLSEAIIHAKGGFVRTGMVEIAMAINGTTVGYMDNWGFTWNNTTDNITSIVLTGSQSNYFGVGSVIDLYRRRDAS